MVKRFKNGDKIMPTITANYKDLCQLIGKKLSKKELEKMLMFVKGELDEFGEELKIDVKETNRPDLWSAEGIAREIKTRTGKTKGLPKYKTIKGKISCTIEKSVTKTRPFITCAIIKNVKVTEHLLEQIIQLQEKIGTTFGRKRKETGIGLYDLDEMVPPVFYKGYKNSEIKFVPLEFSKEMNPKQILREHPKGKEFGYLLEESENYPIVIDSENVVASMPPIINSEKSGKITKKTKNIFLEVTGFNWNTCNTALKIMSMALMDRGAKIETVKMIFPKRPLYPKKSILTPEFGTKKISFELSLIEKISGLKIEKKELTELIKKAGMNPKIKGKKIEVEYPDYRQDVLHAVDIIEDILISKGYNNIELEKIEMDVKGKELEKTLLVDKVRDVCVGMGLQEILTFNLTSGEKQKSIGEKNFVELANPVSKEWGVFRKKIIPEHLEFLQKNKRYEFPQKIFEIGNTLELDSKKETGVKENESVCITLSDKSTDFNKIKSHLDSLCKAFAWNYSLTKKDLELFEKGKSAEIKIGLNRGIIGIVSKKTMEKFGLKEKTAVLELEF